MVRTQSNELLDVATDRATTDFARDVIVGLQSKRKHLPSKYFYDTKGSELFRSISMLPEYYVTRAESEILDTYSVQIGMLLAEQETEIVELGSGCGEKLVSILRIASSVQPGLCYRPADIDKICLAEHSDNIRELIPSLEVHPVSFDFSTSEIPISRFADRRRAVLLLGSTIGNFSTTESHHLLHRLTKELRKGDIILVGFDMQKSLKIIYPAYDDPSGITAAFNLNLLERMNRELGAEFNILNFKHLPRYNEDIHAMESYLQSLEDQIVPIHSLGVTIPFRRGETMHTEYSHKYSDAQIEELAKTCGAEIIENFTDSRAYFTDSVWIKK